MLSHDSSLRLSTRCILKFPFDFAQGTGLRWLSLASPEPTEGSKPLLPKPMLGYSPDAENAHAQSPTEGLDAPKYNARA